MVDAALLTAATARVGDEAVNAALRLLVKMADAHDEALADALADETLQLQRVERAEGDVQGAADALAMLIARHARESDLTRPRKKVADAEAQLAMATALMQAAIAHVLAIRGQEPSYTHILDAATTIVETHGPEVFRQLMTLAPLALVKGDSKAQVEHVLAGFHRGVFGGLHYLLSPGTPHPVDAASTGAVDFPGLHRDSTAFNKPRKAR